MSKQVSLRVSGFQVNVAGNADLKGAVIASTDKAANSNVIVHHADGSVTVAPLNSLTTQTLTTSNLENKADYKASSMSIGAGVGLNKQPDGSYKNSPTASAGSASDSGNGSSVTVSGISAGTVSGQGAAVGGGNQLNFVIDPADRASVFKLVQGSERKLP